LGTYPRRVSPPGALAQRAAAAAPCITTMSHPRRRLALPSREPTSALAARQQQAPRHGLACAALEACRQQQTRALLLRAAASIEVAAIGIARRARDSLRAAAPGSCCAPRRWPPARGRRSARAASGRGRRQARHQGSAAGRAAWLDAATQQPNKAGSRPASRAGSGPARSRQTRQARQARQRSAVRPGGE
jgi:hypothetical protein